MDFHNTYGDNAYAAAYARMEFPGTYYLAFRDLPELLATHVSGSRALDFGCGAGRSTRFLHQLSFDAVGVDIATEMIQEARAIDPAGDYRLVADGDLGGFPDAAFDLAFCAFPFDNIPAAAKKIALFRELARVLRPDGRIVNLVCTPELYVHEWVSFSTQDFPENRQAKCGEIVRDIITCMNDPRPAVDILWPDDAYRDVYRQAGLSVLAVHKPLGRADEPYDWISETKIAPFAIYVLGKA